MKNIASWAEVMNSASNVACLAVCSCSATLSVADRDESATKRRFSLKEVRVYIATQVLADGDRHSATVTQAP